MTRLPRLPRRRQQARPRWQRNTIVAAGGAAEFVAWFGIGFVALLLADTANTGGALGAVLWLAIFCTTISAGSYAMRYRVRIIRAVRTSRTPKRHRRDLSSRSRAWNLSNRLLNWRWRRG